MLRRLQCRVDAFERLPAIRLLHCPPAAELLHFLCLHPLSLQNHSAHQDSSSLLA